MRAWTIVLFILAFQASLAMLNMANPLNTGMGIVVDTNGLNVNAINYVQGNNGLILPQPNGGIYNNTGTDANPIYSTAPGGFDPRNFSSGYIESIFGISGVVGDFIRVLYNVTFAIYITASPYIGDFNAKILQGIALFVLAIGFFQIFTARSLKTAE